MDHVLISAFFLDKACYCHCCALQATRIFYLFLQYFVFSEGFHLSFFLFTDMLKRWRNFHRLSDPRFFPLLLKVGTLLERLIPFDYRRRLSEIHNCVLCMVFSMCSLDYWQIWQRVKILLSKLNSAVYLC